MFFKNFRIVIFVSALFFAALIVLSSQIRQEAGAGFAKKLVLEAAAPLHNALTASIRTIGDAWNRYVYLVNLQEENRRLRRTIDELNSDLVRFREDHLEADRLRQNLALERHYDFKFVAAYVIGREQAALSKTIMINKGSAHGLKTGMPVVASPGLIGRLTDVSWHAAKVLLIIDESSNVDVLVQRTRVQSILRGAGPRSCLLKYVSKIHDVKEGDLVITSGMSNVFPKGILIGVVSGVDRQDVGLFANVRVSPFADFSKLEEVMIIVDETADGGKTKAKGK
ncbi:MAG TPA: rod shape-determining protein MreC [Smithellaceae bacterium]|nr:rod shape-determining protein MreC [Smithellaceae bacterium]